MGNIQNSLSLTFHLIAILGRNGKTSLPQIVVTTGFVDKKSMFMFPLGSEVGSNTNSEFIYQWQNVQKLQLLQK